MEKYILKEPDSFNLIDIFECGQCFRWNKISDEPLTYIGIIKDAVIKVTQNGLDYVFEGKTINNNLEEIVIDYFDLNTDYSKLKNTLAKVDSHLKEAISFGEGIRILNQDVWECIISFIISANNNIPRIKGIIERISKKYGKKIELENKDYYLFPTANELADASVEDLRALGLGFRDKRIFNTTNMINAGYNLDELKSINDLETLRKRVLELDGVGPKVCDCILLFSLKRFDVFPIDVWVRRVMNDLYIKSDDEESINKNEIFKLADDKFGNLKGLAQQYLFYWRREK